MEKLFNTNGTKFVVTYNEEIVMVIDARNIYSAEKIFNKAVVITDGKLLTSTMVKFVEIIELKELKEKYKVFIKSKEDNVFDLTYNHEIGDYGIFDSLEEAQAYVEELRMCYEREIGLENSPDFIICCE